LKGKTKFGRNDLKSEEIDREVNKGDKKVFHCCVWLIRKKEIELVLTFIQIKSLAHMCFVVKKLFFSKSTTMIPHFLSKQGNLATK